MAVTMRDMGISVGVFGWIAFVLGVLAERKKPDAGTASISNGVAVCKYPSDPSVFLGFLSIAALTASASLGFASVFYPYKGKSIPRRALFNTTSMIVYFIVALLVSFFAEGMLLWASITELLHLTRNVHQNILTKCPTAKTGLFGGGATLALDAALFWLLCLMFTSNARGDYYYYEEEEEAEGKKGEYGQVLLTVADQEANEKR
ncbi:hypothetical protein Tsubulata_006347 [Turnera subulata]|uniref:Uncharacterized protein n=1 Tax=Turnera subulata TaxID=218843 RepID=A0A9Q0G8S0_9ROSI|nr:hypothetical protein Tsubulata_006347 [Turnera subulata]